MPTSTTKRRSDWDIKTTKTASFFPNKEKVVDSVKVIWSISSHVITVVVATLAKLSDTF